MKKGKNYAVIIIGIILLATGLYFVKTVDNPEKIMIVLPYILIGAGCGAFGHGMGSIIEDRTIRHSPHLQKEIEIMKNDERNIAISNCAKARGYDMMTYVFGALIITFALMGVDMIAVLLLVFCYLFVKGYALYYRFKYDREM